MHTRRWLLALSLTALIGACTQQPEPELGGNARAVAVSDAVIYADALSSGWENWSWSVNGVDFNSTGYYSGTKSIKVDAQAWGALSLRYNGTAFSTSTYSSLKFFAYAPAANQSLKVYAYGDDSTIAGSSVVSLNQNAWKEINLSWSQLGNPSSLKRIAIQHNVGAAGQFYVDEVRLVANATNPPPPPPPASGCSSIAGLDESAYYRITAKHSGKSLDVANNSTANGGNVQQWDFGGGNNQQWQLTSVGSGYYKVVARHSGKALDVDGVSTTNGANIHQWDYVGGGNQQWCFTDIGGGYYKVIVKHSGKALDVAGISTANGANIHQWDYLGTQDNQKWSLVKVTTSTNPPPAPPPPSPPPSTWALSPGINLGGALEAPSEGEWGYTIQQDHLRKIKEAGFKSVRIPVRWSSHAPTSAPYTIDANFFSRVDQVIQWANDQGLLAVLDMHHWGYNGDDYDSIFINPDSQRQRFMKLWEQVAARYKDRPNDRLYFELFNEPHDGGSKNGVWTTCTATLPANKCFKEDNEYWAGFLQEGLNVIRNSGGNNGTRKVIIGNAQWNNPLYSLNATFANALPASDRNIIVTMHMYEDFCFSHYAWEAKNNCRTWNGTDAEKAKITESINAIVNFKNTYNRPVYVGEWGPTIGKDGNNTEYASRVRYTKYIASEFARLGLDHAFFDFGSKTWGIFDASTGNWQTEMLNAALNR
jgi:endoglucanase